MLTSHMKLMATVLDVTGLREGDPDSPLDNNPSFTMFHVAAELGLSIAIRDRGEQEWTMAEE